MSRSLGRALPARMSDVRPQVDPQTRTLRVRFELDDLGNILRSDMFVGVELPIGIPPTIAVPADAVVDVGVKKMVYVAKGEGVFEKEPTRYAWRAAEGATTEAGKRLGQVEWSAAHRVEPAHAGHAAQSAQR